MGAPAEFLTYYSATKSEHHEQETDHPAAMILYMLGRRKDQKGVAGYEQKVSNAQLVSQSRMTYVA